MLTYADKQALIWRLDLTSKTKLVLLYLNSHDDKSIEAIAAHSGLSVRTTLDLIALLQRWEILNEACEINWAAIKTR